MESGTFFSHEIWFSRALGCSFVRFLSPLFPSLSSSLCPVSALWSHSEYCLQGKIKQSWIAKDFSLAHLWPGKASCCKSGRPVHLFFSQAAYAASSCSTVAFMPLQIKPAFLFIYFFFFILVWKDAFIACFPS